jgi:hypothetical protein
LQALRRKTPPNNANRSNGGSISPHPNIITFGGLFVPKTAQFITLCGAIE